MLPLFDNTSGFSKTASDIYFFVSRLVSYGFENIMILSFVVNFMNSQSLRPSWWNGQCYTLLPIKLLIYVTIIGKSTIHALI